MNEIFSIWTLIRASGLLAFYFMTISLAFGLLSSLSIMKKKKTMLVSIHQTGGWYGLLTIVFHMMLIWQDKYVPYSLGEILLPFSAKNAPILSALGTLSFYFFSLVIVSSDFFIKKLGIKRWKKLHFYVIPAWILMVIHGLAIGTDSSKPWALFIYASGCSTIVIIGFIRYIESVLMPKQSKRPITNNKNKSATDN